MYLLLIMVSMQCFNVLLSSAFITQDLNCTSINIGTVNGDVQILPDHCNFCSTIKNGVVTCNYKREGSLHYKVKSGVVMVQNNSCSILADSFEKIDQ